MGLDNYKEIRKKVIKQMEDQSKKVKTIAVEQWLRENGFEEKNFNNYNEAKEYVEKNINKDSNKRKSFYEFEHNIDTTLETIMEDLKFGSSSNFNKTFINIFNKTAPFIRLLLVAIAINFIATKAAEIGLIALGEKVYSTATDGLGFGLKIPIIKDIIQQSLNNINTKYNEYVVPVATKTVSTVVGILEGYGIIKTLKYRGKINKIESENKNYEMLVSDLQNEISYLRTNTNKHQRISSVGKMQQMKLVVNTLKELFSDEGIDIPEIPEKCYTIEQYGIFLREYLKMHNNPKDLCDKIYISLDICKNNIGRINKKYKLRRGGIISKTKEFFRHIPKETTKILSDHASKTVYAIKNASRKTFNSEELNEK